MPVLSVANYIRADWDAAEPFVHTALCTNAALLRVTDVHVGQVGTIVFNPNPFTAPPNGAASILTAALAHTGAQLAPGITVELHGHFTTVQVPQRRHEYRRELNTIAFKLTQPGAGRPQYLGRVNRTDLSGDILNRLEREINRRRWWGR